MLQDQPQEVRAGDGAPFDSAALRVAIEEAHLTLGAAQDLRPAELAVALAYAILIVLFGLLPSLVLDLIAPAAQLWVARSA